MEMVSLLWFYKSDVEILSTKKIGRQDSCAGKLSKLLSELSHSLLSAIVFFSILRKRLSVKPYFL